MIEVPLKPGLLSLNALVQFVAACSFLLLLSFAYELTKKKKPFSFSELLIRPGNETFPERSHFSKRQRFNYLYIRNLIAIGGYFAFGLAKISIGIIDNSSIYGSDALVYALIAWGVLNQQFNRIEWAGIAVSSFGLALILVYEKNYFDGWEVWMGFGMGLISTISLAILMIITTVVIKHETPLRVAFHQCLLGLALAVILFLIFNFDLSSNDMRHFPYLQTATGGIAYALGLLFIFKSFLGAQPIVIAALGYLLVLFISLFDYLIFGDLPSVSTLLCSLIIAIGCGLLVSQEHKNSKLKH